MTPAINQLKKKKIAFSIHEYEHDPNCHNFGEEAATKLNLDANTIFKTLLVTDDKAAFVAIVPVTGQLNLKAAANAMGVKKLRMVAPKDAERITGYVVGGISPIGQKKQLLTCIDDSAQAFSTVYVSGGKRGLDLGLAPQDLSLICRNATFANIRDNQ